MARAPEVFARHDPDGPLWASFPLDDDWQVYARFAAEDGRPVLAELRVLPKPRDEPEGRWNGELLGLPKKLKPDSGHRWRIEPPREPKPPRGGLTARALRQVSLSRAYELAYNAAESFFAIEADFAPQYHDFKPDALNVPRRPGRKGRPDSFYALVASLYVRAVDSGSRRPVVDVASNLNKRVKSRSYSAAQVRDLLHEARRRDLLSKPPPGRAGGKLTKKGLRVLDERKETQ